MSVDASSLEKNIADQEASHVYFGFLNRDGSPIVRHCYFGRSMYYEAAEVVDRHESGAQYRNWQACCKVSMGAIGLEWCGQGNGTISCLQVPRRRLFVLRCTGRARLLCNYWMHSNCASQKASVANAMSHAKPLESSPSAHSKSHAHGCLQCIVPRFRACS